MNLNRRTLLRGAGVSLALPLLDAMLPRFGRAARAGEDFAVNRKIILDGVTVV